MTNHPSRSAAARERVLRFAVRTLLSLHRRRDAFWYRSGSLHAFTDAMDDLAELTESADKRPGRPFLSGDTILPPDPQTPVTDDYSATAGHTTEKQT